MALKQLAENERNRTVICPAFLNEQRSAKIVEFALEQLENLTETEKNAEKWREFEAYFTDLSENGGR